MKAQHALAPFETAVAEKAVSIAIGAGAAPVDETTDDFWEALRPARPWTRMVADRPTPDDWPICD